MNILVSACLMGVSCRYNAQGAAMERLDELMERHTLIPVCPEQLGGLPTPREPCERRGGRIYSKSGEDQTQRYEWGADEALRLARLYGCSCAILKERSPSCGHGKLYDGTFTGTLTAGNGVCAEKLAAAGVTVLGESRAAELLRPER